MTNEELKDKQSQMTVINLQFEALTNQYNLLKKEVVTEMNLRSTKKEN